MPTAKKEPTAANKRSRGAALEISRIIAPTSKEFTFVIVNNVLHRLRLPIRQGKGVTGLVKK